MAEAAVEARGVTKAFGEGPDRVVALDNVSVEIRQNEFFTLLGPSGCGKTTLLRLIAGFDQPTSGTILLDGQDISRLPPHRRPVNTVFQNYALFPHMSVAGNISFGLEMLGKPKSEIGVAVDDMLRLVQMEALKNRRTGQLSGGQQQRVALARALAPRPKVLLLDEPLSALDLKLRKEMQIELKRLQHETGITFVFVTHDQEEALTMSDRVAVMSNGRILQIGSPHDIYDRPAERFVADFIGDINLLAAKAVKNDSGAVHAEIPGVGLLDIADATDVVEGQTLTLAIRPERIGLSADADGNLPGHLDTIVYHGTDTIYHFTLADGFAMRARVQNSGASQLSVKTGDTIGWHVDAAGVAVIREETP